MDPFSPGSPLSGPFTANDLLMNDLHIRPSSHRYLRSCLGTAIGISCDGARGTIPMKRTECPTLPYFVPFIDHHRMARRIHTPIMARTSHSFSGARQCVSSVALWILAVYRPRTSAAHCIRPTRPSSQMSRPSCHTAGALIRVRHTTLAVHQVRASRRACTW